MRYLPRLLCALPLIGLAACGSGRYQPDVGSPNLQFTREFRIVNWNVAGLDDGFEVPQKAQVVAQLVVAKVQAIDANVITLQEGTVDIHRELEKLLGSAWRCYAWSPGFDWLITCVKGRGEGFVGQPLAGLAGGTVGERWWGWTEIEYQGVKIANVHTRCGFDGSVCQNAIKWHVPELYDKISTGIIAGDFNHETPESDGWHQTALGPTPDYTLRTAMTKVDHVLTVEQPRASWAEAKDEAPPYTGISNHRALLTRVTLAVPGP